MKKLPPGEAKRRARARCKSYYRVPTHKRAALARASVRYTRFRAIALAAKGTKCCEERCTGRVYQPCQLDFDHVRGVKKFNIAIVTAAPSEKALREEIAKCEVVCANCHRLRTFT